ncbi:MAG: hypothetical protein IJC71_07950 [Clostridia bacterium]|nr:hypothetical protein [Clostridia bacterium]
MFKRILCALMASLMLLPLAACSDSKVNPSNDSANASGNANANGEGEEETRKFLDDMPEKMDFEGKQMRFIVEEGANGNLSELSIRVEEDTGDVVDSAVFNRNLVVSDRLNVEISLVDCLQGGNTVAPLVRTSVNAGSDDYDVIGLYQYFGASFASENMLLNMASFPYNDFKREYWGSMYIDAMSYKGKVFWATGDLALRYTGGMYVTYVNDTIWNNYYAGQNIYDVVDEGAWTIDKLYEYTSAVYEDRNADGAVDANDTLGLALVYNDLIDGMCAGLMVEFGRVDDNGNPYISLNNEHTISAYEKLYKLTHGNPGFIQPSTDDSITLMTKFNEGRYMITINKLYQSAIYLREMEDNFKIIPLPKYDENQANYNTRIHDSVTLFGVPTTAVENTEVISATLEAMASESYKQVSPAYYEVALKVKFTRDSDSGRMIDLIASHVSTDFVTLYSNALSDINHFFRNNLGGGKEAISSSFRTSEKVWAKIMEKFLAKLEDAGEQ